MRFKFTDKPVADISVGNIYHLAQRIISFTGIRILNKPKVIKENLNIVSPVKIGLVFNLVGYFIFR